MFNSDTKDILDNLAKPQWVVTIPVKGGAMLDEKLDIETETIDRLYLELSQFTKARTKREMQLEELLYAVEKKFPGESRFETALRYIRERERAGNDPRPT